MYKGVLAHTVSRLKARLMTTGTKSQKQRLFILQPSNATSIIPSNIPRNAVEGYSAINRLEEVDISSIIKRDTLLDVAAGYNHIILACQSLEGKHDYMVTIGANDCGQLGR